MTNSGEKVTFILHQETVSYYLFPATLALRIIERGKCNSVIYFFFNLQRKTNGQAFTQKNYLGNSTIYVQESWASLIHNKPLC